MQIITVIAVLLASEALISVLIAHEDYKFAKTSHSIKNANERELRSILNTNLLIYLIDF